MTDSTPLLEVADLAVFYGDVQALWDVSLAVGAGEMVAVIGSNGAGKTTLLSTIAGLLKPARGTVRYEGRSIEHLAAHAICDRELALVPEGGQPFPEMTVRENLEMGAYLGRARGSAKRNLERAFDLFPRLRERTKQLAGSLSGGERQMLAIARALMSEPRLLMLDEPSLGLAPVVVDHIFDTLVQLRRDGLTVLLVEQNVDEAMELADRAYVLQSGRVIAQGATSTLQDDPAIKQHYLGI